MYRNVFERLAPFTPAGNEAENHSRVGELVSAIDRLQAVSPEPIRSHSDQVKAYAHKVKDVLAHKVKDVLARTAPRR